MKVRAAQVLRTAALTLLAPAALLAGPPAASAQGPRWQLESRPAPTVLQPGTEALLVVAALNLGDGEASGSAGSPIVLSDTLPAGLTAVEAPVAKRSGLNEERVTCALETTGSGQRVTCSFPHSIAPYARLEAEIKVQVAPTAKSGEANTVAVAGGGAPATGPLQRPLTVGPEATAFGAEAGGFSLAPEEEDGSAAVQAGSHPFELTTTLNLNETLAKFEQQPGTERFPSSPALARNLHFHLPPGLLGNPTAVPQCPDADFATIIPRGTANLCKAEAAVGVAVVTVNEPRALTFKTLTVPVFNLVPAPGEPARMGFYALHDLVLLDTAVKSAEGYAVEVTVTNTTQAAQLLGSVVTIWGEPQAASHDASRGWQCVEGGAWIAQAEPCAAPAERSTKAFLTLPVACTGPLASTLEGDSWPTAEAPGGLTLSASTPIAAMGGCERVPFAPAFDVETDEHAASTPTGMTVAVTVPQHGTETGTELAESDVRTTTLTLPQGILLSPGAANGLLACSGEQVGLQPGFDEALQAENTGFSEALPGCPGQLEEGEGATRREGAKVASVTITTPLLDHPLHGGAFLAFQNTNPFASPLVLYLLVHDPASGTLVKLAGTVAVDPDTGQLTSTFANTPQLPFSELQLHFFNGGRGSVSTPQLCGSYTSAASFAPWSGGAAQSPPPQAPFVVGTGPGGGGCPSPQQFSPGLQAGPLSLQAGAFAAFTLNLQNPDGDQPLSEVTTTLPPGLAAVLASVLPCPEPQAAQGTCGPESLIGHATTSSGLGPEPVTLPGSVYLTGPYGHAPFGLAIVTPAVAGPFDLGTVVVRSAINVDPNTAAVTIDTVLPTFVEPTSGLRSGVPVALKAANVTIDRPGFEFNPTDCAPASIVSTLRGAQGAVLTGSYPFRVEGCAGLPFKPVFEAETDAATSRVNGAALRIKVTSPGLGQANIAKTKVVLPLALPSRLTTLQKACLAVTFEANPATCPEGSVIGTATIRTPVFHNPLQGPAILVSHGGAAFPDVEFVLQGEGVTIVLDGKTDIRHGITTSAFEALPDAPFTSFQTILPEGPHSALAAVGSLCAPTQTVKRRVRVARRSHGHIVRRNGRTVFTTKTVATTVVVPLQMPTTITAQNGAVIEQNTVISVRGCPRSTTARHRGKTSARRPAKRS